MSQESIIVILAYDIIGKYAWIYDQAKYCILSILSRSDESDGIRFCVYSDSISQFNIMKGCSDFVGIDEKYILSSFGHNRYMHRLKTVVILDALERYKGNVVFCDSDMFAKNNINKRIRDIRDDTIVVFCIEKLISEYRIGSSDIYRIIKTPFIQKYQREILDSCIVNSGVIGISYNNKSVIAENLAIMDEGLRIIDCHIWEQLALSIAIHQSGLRVLTCDEFLHHYWDQRDEYTAAISPIIRHIEGKNMPIQDAVEYVRSHPLNVPPYRRQSLPIRLWRKITGQSRMPSIRIQDDIRKFE